MMIHGTLGRLGRGAQRWLRRGALLALASAVVACAAEPAADVTPEPLRIAVHGDPSSLDPHLQSEVIAQWVLGNVYDTLVAFDVNMGLVPSLAERWENLGDRVVRFHLRAGVTFHDGRPLTSADVAASLERARHHPRSRSASSLVAVAEVRLPDERTIELETASPYPILLNKLAFLLIAPAGAPETIDEPIGTGPYRLAAYERGRRVVLEAHAAHWRGAPPEPRVEYHFVSDSGERLDRLRAGDFHLIDDLAPDAVARLEETPPFQVLSRSSLAVTYLQMNPAVEPFTDVRVRRAVDLAFDRGALVRDVLLGHGRPVRQMASPNVYGYAPRLEPLAQDIGEARRLLAEAGYPGGLDLTLEIREDAFVEPVREQLAAIGVRIEPAPRPWSEMYPRLQSGAVAFYLGGWVSISGDASDFLDQKAHSHDPERGYGVSNSNRFSHPELDRLIEASGTLGMEARREILERALGLVAAEHVFIPLYTPFDLYGARDDLEWTPRQDGKVYAFEMRRAR